MGIKIKCKIKGGPASFKDFFHFLFINITVDHNYSVALIGSSYHNIIFMHFLFYVSDDLAIFHGVHRDQIALEVFGGAVGSCLAF